MGDGRLDVEQLAGEVARECTRARSCSTWTPRHARRRDDQRRDARRDRRHRDACRSPVEAFEAAIRADGKAVEANLRGFRSGACRRAASACRRWPPLATAKPTLPGPKASPISRRRQPRFPAPRDIIVEGLRRLVAYQDLDYARLYLERLRQIARADARRPTRLLRETARHLAVRMSYEDVIRVAEEKIAPARIAGIVAKMGGKPGEPVAIVEFLKPGIEEFCQLLPPRLARVILGAARRRGWIDRFHWGMEVRTTSVAGYLRFLLLAKLKRFRRRTYRYCEEQAAIEAWLALIAAAAAKSTATGPRSRGMRAADQGLWRHLEARRCELRGDRGACDRCRALGAHAPPARHRCCRERTHRRPRRPRRRGAGTLSRRDRARFRPRHRRRVTRIGDRRRMTGRP